MTSYKKSFVIWILAITLFACPLSAIAVADHFEIDLERQEPLEPGAVVVDLILVRPLGLVATIAGSVFFIVSVPFSALGGNTEETWDSLVVSPASYTFTRPMGRFEE